MRKIMLLGILCLGALVIGPVASASAAEITGACEISGGAEFKPGLGKELAEVEYKFSGSAKCKPVGGGEVSGTASVSGKGQLQCAVAAGGLSVLGTGAPGKGKLVLNGEEYKFELSFVAQAGIVDLLARPEGSTAYTATGEAEFLTTNGPTAIVQCAQSSLSELSFEAQTAGTI